MKKFKKLILLFGVFLLIASPISAKKDQEFSEAEIEKSYNSTVYNPDRHTHSIDFVDLHYIMRLYNTAYIAALSGPVTQSSTMLLYQAQTLYLTILDLENTYNMSYSNYLSSTTSREIAKMKYDLGMITKLAYEEQILTATSNNLGAEQLANTIQSSKDSLNTLLGYNQGSELKLSKMPAFNAKDFEKIGSAKDLKLAKDNGEVVNEAKIETNFFNLDTSIKTSLATLQLKDETYQLKLKNANIYDLQYQNGMLSRSQYLQLKLSVDSTLNTYESALSDLYKLKIKYDALIKGVMIS